jgi:hypothetical protein
VKKIINGKTYNTKTADVLCFFPSNLDRSDPEWDEAGLYREKKTGQLFYYAADKIATRDGSLRVEENITLVSWEEADEWANEAMCAKDYERIFGGAGGYDYYENSDQ